MWTMFFFHPCFIVLFQYLDIFVYIKSKKKIREKWTRTETPPPHCGFNPSKCFLFFFKLPLDPHFSNKNQQQTNNFFKIPSINLFQEGA